MLIVLSALLASTFATSKALAMPDEQVIVANCRNAQSIMSQLEKADAVLRINRGRLYDDTLNLLYAMNARLSSNHVNAPRLAQITSNFETLSNTFRNDYSHYDDFLANAINVDCVANPVEFYNELDTARTNRAKVAADVTALDQLINDYRTEFNTVIGSAQ